MEHWPEDCSTPLRALRSHAGEKTTLYGGTKVMSALTKAYTRIRESRGQTMAEYALIVGLIAVVTVTVWTLLGTQIAAIITGITTALASVP
jgi:Flp pilus assembly pilin Flp